MPILTPGGNVSPCGELLVAALGLVAHTGGARRGVATARLAELGVPVDEAIQTASRYVGIPTDPDNRTWSVNYAIAPSVRERFDAMVASVLAGTAQCPTGVLLPYPIQGDKLSPCRLVALAALAEVWFLKGPTDSTDRQPLQLAFRDMFMSWYNEIQRAEGRGAAGSISEDDLVDAMSIMISLNGGMKRNGSYSTVESEIQAAREAYAACPAYEAPTPVATTYTGGAAPFLTTRLPVNTLRPTQPAPTPPLAFQVTLTGPRTYAFATPAQAPLTWSFGDGTTSTELAPVRTYAPGTYTVSLTAMVRGAAQTVTSTLTVAPDSPADVVVEKSSYAGWLAAGAAALWLLSRFR